MIKINKSDGKNEKTISIKLSVLAAKRNHEEISGKGAT